MARATRFLALGWLTLAVAMLAAPVAAQEPRSARMTVRVRNDANVPADLVDAATSTARTIFEAAGIDATFIEGPADFTVVLLSNERADKMHQIADAVGFAPGSDTARGRIAYVLQPRVNAIADGYSTLRSIVLAAAIAHEIGHLLMFNAHSSTGIMRPSWNQADFRQAVHGKLLFTPEQAAKMRQRLAESADGVRTMAMGM
jgi:hypothetical protein